jgi:hypothetical protein
MLRGDCVLALDGAAVDRQRALDVSIFDGWQVREHVGEQAWRSMSLAFAVASRLMMRPRLPAVSEAAKSQFLRPMAMGRTAFLIESLSIG